MYFGFDADQLALREGLRDLLRDACPPAVVRAAWDAPLEREAPSALWRRLAELGLLGLLAPAERGGMGGDEVDLVLLMEECGRFAVPGTLLEQIAVGVPLLVDGDDDYAAAAISGEFLVAVQPEPGAGVVGADGADLLILLDGDRAYLAGAEQMSLTGPVQAVDRSMTLFATDVETSVPLTGTDVQLARERATLAVAAQLLGLADRMIQMSVDHAKARTQFGVPIGSQQAVKHHLATALIALEHARPVVLHAGYALAHSDPQRCREVSHAKVYAWRAAHAAARAALQCHGAIGYTWDHDLQLWMKRVWALGPAWGTVAAHERRVADVVLAEATVG